MEARVKNKAVAPLQISAEQILLEAYEHKEQPLSIPKQSITDLEELHEYQGRRRKEFEDALRRKRSDLKQWQRYALWEIDQHEYDRARSIFERALEVDSTNVPLWIKYIQTELKSRNVNFARNLLDRAVTLLPRVEKLWFTYVSVEETLDNVIGTRAIFERWIKWHPGPAAWHAYINLEKRYGEYERARRLFVRFTEIAPQTENWIKWAKFEEELNEITNTRDVYTLAVDRTKQMDLLTEKLLISWAKWESRQQEWDRVRGIYKFGLDFLPKSQSKKLYDSYTQFEKQFGDKSGIEDVILQKRKTKYEALLAEKPSDYDIWFSLITLMEEMKSSSENIRKVYENAISNVPVEKEKQYWRRYIFVWIRYAIYEELINNDAEKTRNIYQRIIELIPHQLFTFTKIWILYAKFEIRNNNIDKARKILGQAIGKTKGGKPSLYKRYIELEIKLKNFDNCRKLYNKYIENYSHLPEPWIDYGSLETELGEIDRARAIYELALTQPNMELKELLWKRFIDFETELGMYSKARRLYEQLTKNTREVKPWISFAVFEMSVPDEDVDEQEEEEETEAEAEAETTEHAKLRARKVFEKAWISLKQKGLKQERAILNDAWLEFEQTYGDEESIEKVRKQTPQLTKKRTRLEDGSWNEFMEYIFPTDEESRSYAKLLENAAKWKKEREKAKE